MPKIRKSTVIHNKSIIYNSNFGSLDYCDSYSVSLHLAESVDKLTNVIFDLPQWVKSLLNIRDNLVRKFGLKTDANVISADYYPIGSKANLFTVVDRNDDEIVMSEDDKHLNFRTSVLVESNAGEVCVYLTTIVHYHNVWGRLYFSIIKYFHQQIMKSCMRNLSKKNRETVL